MPMDMDTGVVVVGMVITKKETEQACFLPSLIIIIISICVKIF
jgi:hypothetical protein